MKPHLTDLSIGLEVFAQLLWDTCLCPLICLQKKTRSLWFVCPPVQLFQLFAFVHLSGCELWAGGDRLEDTSQTLTKQCQQLTWPGFHPLGTPHCWHALGYNSTQSWTVGLHWAAPLCSSAVAQQSGKPQDFSGISHQFRRGCHYPWGFGYPGAARVGG